MITKRQRECLKFIASAEICPSFDEMAFAMGLKSKSGVARIVNGLEERGMINRIPDRARAIEVTIKGRYALLTGVRLGPADKPINYIEEHVDNLMHGIRAELYMLKCAVRHDEPKEEIRAHIAVIENLIKTKWTEK